MNSAGQELYDRLGPIVAVDRDGVGTALCDALGAMLSGLNDLVADTAQGTGWSMLLDPARTPAPWLGWTATLYGVQLITGSTEADQRALIADLPPHHRGTRDAMVAAVARTLTGTKLVRVIERPGDAYSLDIITRTSETPDTAATFAAALSQKPGGIWPFGVIATDEPIIDEGTRTIDAATVTIDAPPTLADVT